ncbi:chymotrypsin-2-like [Cydia pomonella]|uniref:chymotrypsin-2-like n=1 Tax=Cydia pomonella TaxID=82600 RepID=UPI002ADDF54C|nr:chymotrypsin-2-like [Cydia pomonella]
MMSIFLLLLMVEFTVGAIRSKNDLRVYAGEDDTKGQFSFAVILIYVKNNLRFCTGNLLDFSWVLTSAHCVETRTPLDMSIKYGDFTMLETNKIAKVFQIFLHPSFSHVHGFNDIALIFNEKINGLPFGKLLALDYKTLFGLPVRYAGFGRITKDLRPTSHLDILEEQLIPLQVGRGVVIPCESYESFKYSTLCIAPRCTKDHQQARSGDAGGPLMYRGWIIGIERSILTKDNLAITQYIPVSLYVVWIRNIMQSVGNYTGRV